MGAFQQAFGSVPVTNRTPPPEGTMAVQLTATLTELIPSIATTLQLNSQAGLMLSQVITLCIDNTKNPLALNVVHGVLNETNVVPAYGYSIMPTFSGSGNYPINISTATAPDADTPIGITFLNYQRQSANFVNNQSSNANATGNFSGILYGLGTQLISGTGATSLLPQANYVITAIDFAIEWMTCTGAGGAQVGFDLSSPAFIATMSGACFATASQLVQPSMSPPVNLTFPAGLYVPRGGFINLNCTPFTNLNSVHCRVNIYGYTLS